MTGGEDKLVRRGLALAWFIVVWDVVEGVVAVAAGIAANSIALIGFGIDSGIEVFAAAVVIWQLKGRAHARQRLALRLIAITFWALAGYVGIESVRDLVTQDKAGESLVGIVLNVVALAAMVPVAVVQRRTGRSLGNPVLIAQSTETWLSNSLSVTVLAGLGLNIILGWWWADPLVGLAVAGLAVWSGRDAWQEAGEQQPDQAEAGP